MKKYFVFLFLSMALIMSGCKKKEVIIGAVLPLTGDAGLIGQGVKEGIEIAETHIAQNPDYPYSIRVIYKDTKSNPEAAESMLCELIREKSVAVIGGITSSGALKMIDRINEHERVLLSPTASHPDLTGVSPFFFRIYPSDIREVTQLASFTFKFVKSEKIVVLCQDIDYARGFAKAYEDQMLKRKLKDIRVVTLPQDMKKHDEIVTNVMSEAPDSICLIAYPDSLINLLKDLRNNNYKGNILTTSAVTAPGVLARAGDMAEGIMYCRPPFTSCPKDSPIAEKFVNSYEDRYGREPNLVAGYGYDAMMILAEAIKNEGFYPESVVKGLLSLPGFAGVTGNTVFDTAGDVKKSHRVFQVMDGVEVDYVKFNEYKKEKIKEMLIGLKQGKPVKITFTREDLEKFSEDELRKLAMEIGVEANGDCEKVMDKILKLQKKLEEIQKKSR